MTKTVKSAIPLTAMGLLLAAGSCKNDQSIAKMGPDCAQIAADPVAAEYYIGQSIMVVEPTISAESYRILHPGDPVTKDFRRNRLNLSVNESGVITEVGCF